ncbi:uncharacterized protein LOC34619226 [Cyclospora cayetanensis]|uniref:Condensin complex subunit 2 n=1 Tax=Cyclospora cayetanensis TaxID=88456 RepID=A0A6P6S120_9EIME|nr:uncharacterized protein LOC34619226 [Cyclospora cayetanensis]
MRAAAAAAGGGGVGGSVRWAPTDHERAVLETFRPSKATSLSPPGSKPCILFPARRHANDKPRSRASARRSGEAAGSATACESKSKVDVARFFDGEGEAADQQATDKVAFSHVSSAIEGASKVYGYRVEAVYDQTYHLLNGLATLKREGAETGGGDNDEQNARRRQRQQQQRLALFFKGSSGTLADSKDISCEQPDMGVLIDPFFVKMASLFDQAGAKGLLLSNLQVDESLSLRFDGEAPAFPVAAAAATPAAATAAAAANACIVDRGTLADLIFGRAATTRCLDTSICGDAIRHFTEQVEQCVEVAVVCVCTLLGNSEAALSLCGSDLGDAEYEEMECDGAVDDDLLLEFDADVAAAEAANAWEQQHEQQQQQEKQQQALGGSDPLLPEESSVGLSAQDKEQHLFEDEGDFTVDAFSLRQEEEVGALNARSDRLESLLAFPASNSAAAAAAKTQQLFASLDPFLIDMTDLGKPLDVYPLLKTERCVSVLPKPIDSVFVAGDMTSSPFAPSPQQMISLSLLATKQLRFSEHSAGAVALLNGKNRDSGECEDISEGRGKGGDLLPADIARLRFAKSIGVKATCTAPSKALCSETQHPLDKKTAVRDQEGQSRISKAKEASKHAARLTISTSTAQLEQRRAQVPSSDLRLSLPSRYVDVAVVKQTLREALHIKQKKEEFALQKEQTGGLDDGEQQLPFARQPSNSSCVTACLPACLPACLLQTVTLLPAVERQNCTPQMLFVCLLYTANDETLLLTPSANRETFEVCRKAPLAEQLADDQLAVAALQSVASYPVLDLQQFMQKGGQGQQLLPPEILPTEAVSAASPPEAAKKLLRKRQQLAAAAVSRQHHKRPSKKRRTRNRSSSSSSNDTGSDEEEVVT